MKLCDLFSTKLDFISTGLLHSYRSSTQRFRLKRLIIWYVWYIQYSYAIWKNMCISTWKYYMRENPHIYKVLLLLRKQTEVMVCKFDRYKFTINYWSHSDILARYIKYQKKNIYLFLWTLKTIFYKMNTIRWASNIRSTYK